MGEGGECTDSASGDLKILYYFLMCEQAPPKFIENISWEQISVVGQCTVRFMLLRQSNFHRRVHLKLFGTLLF